LSGSEGSRALIMTSAKKRRGFSGKDLREVSDSPEFTKADFAKAKSFSEVFPDLSSSIRRGCDPNNEVKGANRVVHDVTSKSPGKIEWE
jgi:GMP synthase PP-ATPase subunit